MKISVVSKNPPGGRCTLYCRYADVLALQTNGMVEVTYGAAEDTIAPPALVVAGRQVAPADGLVLDPIEVHAAALAAGFEGDGQTLLLALETAQEKMMEEWASGGQ